MISTDAAGRSSVAAQKTADARAARAGPGTGLPEGRDPETPAEAAKEFEKVLVRRFVKVMTKDMFSNSLAGEEGGGWMKSQRGTQRDMMTDMLTDHLVESDSLQISDGLMKKWGVAPRQSSPAATPPLRQSVDPLPASPTDAPPANDNARQTPGNAQSPRFDRAA